MDTTSLEEEVATMSRRRSRYPAEYRRQMVDLVRSGQSPDHLAREFEPPARSIRNWVGPGGP